VASAVLAIERETFLLFSFSLSLACFSLSADGGSQEAVSALRVEKEGGEARDEREKRKRMEIVLIDW